MLQRHSVKNKSPQTVLQKRTQGKLKGGSGFSNPESTSTVLSVPLKVHLRHTTREGTLTSRAKQSRVACTKDWHYWLHTNQVSHHPHFTWGALRMLTWDISVVLSGCEHLVILAFSPSDISYPRPLRSALFASACCSFSAFPAETLPWREAASLCVSHPWASWEEGLSENFRVLHRRFSSSFHLAVPISLASCVVPAEVPMGKWRCSAEVRRKGCW